MAWRDGGWLDCGWFATHSYRASFHLANWSGNRRGCHLVLALYFSSCPAEIDIYIFNPEPTISRGHWLIRPWWGTTIVTQGVCLMWLNDVVDFNWLGGCWNWKWNWIRMFSSGRQCLNWVVCLFLDYRQWVNRELCPRMWLYHQAAADIAVSMILSGAIPQGEEIPLDGLMSQKYDNLKGTQ